MKYSKEDRLEIGRRIYEGELTRNEAAEEYQISTETARNYTYLYRDLNRLPDLRQKQRAAVLPDASLQPEVPSEPPAFSAFAGTEEYDSMSRDELIRELVRYRVNEARLKKGYEVKGAGAAKRFVPIVSRNI